MVAKLSSRLCSELIYAAAIPLRSRPLTWSRIRAISGENTTVSPGNCVAGNW